MKKILFVICIMCFFMACSKESNSSSSSSSTDESAEISNISYKIAESDKEHITQAVEGLKNIIIKDDFDLSVSKDLQSIRSFNQGYYPFLSNKEAYDRFFECVPKFFENRDFNANSVVFSGEIFSKLLTEYYDKVDEIRNYVFNTEGLREEAANIRIDELIKEKGLVEPELPKVKDYEDELFNDDTSVLMYIYQDTGKEDETPIFMEAQSPIGNGIFRFNRGVAVDRFFKAQNQEVPFMETYDQLRWFGDMVKSVRPDSEEEVKMLDKTVTVKEAVSVFENYFNSLDFIDNKCETAVNT